MIWRDYPFSLHSEKHIQYERSKINNNLFFIIIGITVSLAEYKEILDGFVFGDFINHRGLFINLYIWSPLQIYLNTFQSNSDRNLKYLKIIQIGNNSQLFKTQLNNTNINIQMIRKYIYCFSHQGRKTHFFKLKDQKPVKNQIIYPQQYPKHSLDDNLPMVNKGRPIRYLEQRHDIPIDKTVTERQLIIEQKYNNKWQSPLNAYKLNVGLIGPVNSGKSQLMGKLGYKVSAVSPKSNTTDQIMHCFKSFEMQTEEGLKNVQLKFYDTPGIMYKKTGFISKGWKVLSQIDFSLLVVDSNKRFEEITKQSIKRLQKHRNYQNFMKALVLNKIDLVDNQRKFHTLISEIEKYGKFDKIFYTSAKTGYGIKQLENYLLSMAKPGDWQVPKEAKTDMTTIEVYEQMMKQAYFHRVYKEVPHIVGIYCQQSAIRSDNIEMIKFKLTVRTENQQRMLIGKEGRNIQNIINRFKRSFAEMYNRECECHVTVSIRNKFNEKYGGAQIDEDDDRDGMRKIQQNVNFAQRYLKKKDILI